MFSICPAPLVAIIFVDDGVPETVDDAPNVGS
jgi:hypothetical protein